MDFKPTQEMIKSAETVFMVMAWKDTIEPIVKEYQRVILINHQFVVDGEVMINPDRAWLLNDEDFKVYIEETYKERDKAGLKVDNPEFCPLLVAEMMQIDAENALIETMRPAIGLNDIHIYGDNRKKLIELTLRLLAPFVKIQTEGREKNGTHIRIVE